MYFNKKQKIFPDMNLKTETSHGEGDINLDSDRKHNEPLKRKTTKNNENLLSFFFNKTEHQEPIFEDGRITKYLFNKLMYLDFASLVMSSLGLIISVLQYDVEYLDATGYINKYLTWVIFISTLILLFFTTVRYFIQLEIMKAQKILSKDKSFFKSSLLFPYCIEICILAPCPLPFVIDMGFQIKDFHAEEYLEWNVNYILSLYILLRIIVIGRVFLNLTAYCNYRAARIGRMYGVDTNYVYCLRCIMKNSPGLLLSILFFWTTVIFGHAMRICERVFAKDPNYSEDKMQYGYYYNAFWNIIVTMTTVGYGDYYPRTIPGRFIIFLVCILGIFIVSSIVVALTEYLGLTREESKVLNVIMRLQKRVEVKIEAAYVLTIMAKIHFLQKNKNLNPTKKNNEIVKMQENLRDHIKAFKVNNRQLRDMFEGFSDFENMNNSFGFVKLKFYDLLEKQKQLNLLNERIGLSLGVNLERT